jgi:hypothetical protein
VRLKSAEGAEKQRKGIAGMPISVTQMAPLTSSTTKRIIAPPKSRLLRVSSCC